MTLWCGLFPSLQSAKITVLSYNCPWKSWGFLQHFCQIHLSLKNKSKFAKLSQICITVINLQMWQTTVQTNICQTLNDYFSHRHNTEYTKTAIPLLTDVMFVKERNYLNKCVNYMLLQLFKSLFPLGLWRKVCWVKDTDLLWWLVWTESPHLKWQR